MKLKEILKCWGWGSFARWRKKMADSKGPRKKTPSRPRVQSGPLKQTTLKFSPAPGPPRRSGGGAKPGPGGAGTSREPSSSSTTTPSVTKEPREPKEPPKLRFCEVKGDLFGCPASCSLGHCVSEDMAMGKGVAVPFKEKFGGVAALRAQGNRLG